MIEKLAYWVILFAAFFISGRIVYTAKITSDKPKYKNSNLSILSDEDASGELLWSSFGALASLGWLRAYYAGIGYPEIFGWMIGSGLTPFVIGLFLWVISLIWVKPKDRTLRWKQFVFWTAVFLLIGNWLYFFQSL